FRLFVDPLIDLIDPLGSVNPKSKNLSVFRRLLIFQCEKYLGSGKWQVPASHQLEKFIGLSLCAKYGPVSEVDEDTRTAALEHGSNIYVRDMNPAHAHVLVERCWKDATEEGGAASRRNLGSKRSYEKEFLSLARTLDEYGCDIFACTLEKGPSDLSKVLANDDPSACIRVGINSHGIYVFGEDPSSSTSSTSSISSTSSSSQPTRMVLATYQIDFSSSGKKSKEGSEIRLRTPDASHMSSLLNEYAMALLNVRSGCYKEVGITHASTSSALVKSQARSKRGLIQFTDDTKGPSPTAAVSPAPETLSAVSEATTVLDTVSPTPSAPRTPPAAPLDYLLAKEVASRNPAPPATPPLPDDGSSNASSSSETDRFAMNDSLMDDSYMMHDQFEIDIALTRIQAVVRSFLVRCKFRGVADDVQEKAAVTVQAALRKKRASMQVEQMRESDRQEQEEMEKMMEWKRNLEKQREEKLARDQKEKEERERLRLAEKEQFERDRKERLEKERLEKERVEKERLEKERLEKERLEKERAAKAELARLQAETEAREKAKRESAARAAEEEAKLLRAQEAAAKTAQLEAERLAKEKEKEKNAAAWKAAKAREEKEKEKDTSNPYYENITTAEIAWELPAEVLSRLLPAGWIMHVDDDTSEAYYENIEDGRTQWTRPFEPQEYSEEQTKAAVVLCQSHFRGFRVRHKIFMVEAGLAATVVQGVWRGNLVRKGASKKT
ncbi:hypothetical protein TeGR_g9474, partial [Tetraparma gracilis]